MINKSTMAATATAVLLMTAAFVSPTSAASWSDRNGAGYGAGVQTTAQNDHDWSGENRAYADRDYQQGFHDSEFSHRGRFYYNGNIRQRYERLEHWTRFMARSGQLTRREAAIAFEMLGNIRQQAFRGFNNGHVSPWQKARLNRGLDRLVMFLRQARYDGHSWGHHDGGYRNYGGSRYED